MLKIIKYIIPSRSIWPIGGILKDTLDKCKSWSTDNEAVTPPSPRATGLGPHHRSIKSSSDLYHDEINKEHNSNFFLKLLLNIFRKALFLCLFMNRIQLERFFYSEWWGVSERFCLNAVRKRSIILILNCRFLLIMTFEIITYIKQSYYWRVKHICKIGEKILMILRCK